MNLNLPSATRDEDAVYATLLGRIDDETKERRPEGREIGDLIIATNFDLSKLTAKDFAALSRERDELCDFRKLLAERAKSSGGTRLGDPGARQGVFLPGERSQRGRRRIGGNAGWCVTISRPAR